MVVLKRLEDLPKLSKAAISIGVFDGVHIGHRKILSMMCSLDGYTKCILTFQNHPEWLIKSSSKMNPKLISPPHYKLEVFEKEFNIDIVLFIKFSPNLKKLEAEEFIRFLKSRVDDLHIFVGYNFRFGYGAKGDTDFLARKSLEYGFIPHVADEIFVDNMKVSSTEIRKLIYEGYIELANKLLGRRFFLESKVIKGKGRGLKIGFPTANIRSKYQVYPPPGVYGTITEVDGKKYKSVTHVGVSPTFGGNSFDVETHIIDFSENIYGKKIRIYFDTFLGQSKFAENIDKIKEIISEYIDTWKKYPIE